MWSEDFKTKKYNIDEIDLKHNVTRMKNDLSWLYSDFENIHNLVSLYWFDIELKNICFPWVLKLEREFKSVFIWHYKRKFNSSDSQFLLEKTNYQIKKDNLKKIDKIIYNVEEVLAEKQSNNIDELVFSLTFGEFVTTFSNFSQSIFNRVSNYFNLSPDVFCNILKYLNILRNSIAHNKTILKTKDEKNNKRFSLKSAFFNFDITKEHIDILSINAGGVIYVIANMLKISDVEKAKGFLKTVNQLLKKLKHSIDSKEVYNQIINKVFLHYIDNILEIK